MNLVHPRTLEKANEAAICCLYLYLAHKTTPADHEPFGEIAADLEAAMRSQAWNYGDIRRLHILKNAIGRNASLAKSQIGSLTRSQSGMTACTFTKPNGEVFVIFKGTGSGEWLDNGEGLSGIPEENTYITYDGNGRAAAYQTVSKDYASDRQAEALNWFHRIAAENGWTMHHRITLSGHSKGGNKAQFVAVHSDLADACYSFCGQGFSPEAMTALRKQYGAEFEARRQKIHSFASYNDYVNVLGERLMPENQIYYMQSAIGFHPIESILDATGRFHPQCEQGKLSRYVQSVSEELMGIPPRLRQYATLGVMHIFRNYLGDGTTANADTVSVEETIAGVAIAVGALLSQLREDSAP